MDTTLHTYLDNLWSEDRELQNKAFSYILEATEKPVDWAYEVWNDLLAGLTHKDNHVRAIAAQVLCNLAKSDPEDRILKDLRALLEVTKDERFVTARHCMQSLWKIGVAEKQQKKQLMEGLEVRFKGCINEKNCTLIRYDILQSLRNMYDALHDDEIKEKALSLIETEADLKYRKKYATLWRSK